MTIQTPLPTAFHADHLLAVRPPLANRVGTLSRRRSLERLNARLLTVRPPEPSGRPRGVTIADDPREASMIGSE